MPVSVLRESGTFGASGVTDERSDVSGIVPDGVTAIIATYGGAARTVEVHDNFFAFEHPLKPERASHPDRLEWRLADGSVRKIW